MSPSPFPMGRAALSRRGLLALGGAAGVAAVLSACAPQRGPARSTLAPTPSTGEAPQMDSAARSLLDTAFEKAFAASGMVGAAAVVRAAGGDWSRSEGVADLETQRPYDPSDTVRIASITKSFTGTAVLQMVDEGLVRLDDTLSRWFPAIPSADVITLEQMLGMTSGIYDFTADTAFDDLFAADPIMAWDIDDTVEVILRNAPSFAPGTGRQYSDSNFALLGEIVRAVRGASLDEVYRDRIIDPLGLTRTLYPTDAVIPSPHPTGYVPQDIDPDTGAFLNDRTAPRVVDEVNPAVAAGAGAMLSTLGDLQAWGDELVNGTLLSTETQRLRLKTGRFDGQKLDFGYGLAITNLGEYLGHDGAIFGFSTVVFTNPRNGVQVAIVGNESSNETTPTLTMAVDLIKVLDPAVSF